jgi:hypothetical protein
MDEEHMLSKIIERENCVYVVEGKKFFASWIQTTIFAVVLKLCSLSYNKIGEFQKNMVRK